MIQRVALWDDQGALLVGPVAYLVSVVFTSVKLLSVTSDYVPSTSLFLIPSLLPPFLLSVGSNPLPPKTLPSSSLKAYENLRLGLDLRADPF